MVFGNKLIQDKQKLWNHTLNNHKMKNKTEQLWLVNFLSLSVSLSPQRDEITMHDIVGTIGKKKLMAHSIEKRLFWFLLYFWRSLNCPAVAVISMNQFVWINYFISLFMRLCVRRTLYVWKKNNFSQFISHHFRHDVIRLKMIPFRLWNAINFFFNGIAWQIDYI